MTDDYSRHEILHMTSAIERLIERELAEHPAIMANPDWAGYVSRAATELQVLYQEIGAEHLSAPPQPFEKIYCVVTDCGWWVAKINSSGETVPDPVLQATIADHLGREHPQAPL